ncbi:MAG: 4'-phosphopantetheinyl transferase superfamily protein [Succinivibrio sp.]|nr:4'-phosphopantetheinyl transferase superfamily protein [Succinivibrio sp.]
MFSELAVGRIADLMALESIDQRLFDYAARFKGKRRESFLASRILLLLLLKKVYPQLEQLPKMLLMQYGKPYFSDFKCYFNLTHSASSAIAYISDVSPCAVDLEFLKPRYNFDGLKNKVLGPGEWPYFNAVAENVQLETFTALWTIRECVLKLSGRGLGGLSQIEIDLAQKSMRCPDNQSALIHCVRFDDYLEGKPSFCSYSEPLGESTHSPEEELVGQESGSACLPQEPFSQGHRGFWQFKAGELEAFEQPRAVMCLRLNAD